MNRRALLGTVAALAAAGTLPRATAGATPRRLRPPGALPPGDFEAACIGCFRCAEVCPPRCLRFPSLLSLEAALPHLEPAERACTLCMACTQVCPTGALAPVAPAPESVAAAVRMGVPRLQRRDCLAWNGRGVCRLCHHVCPYPDRAVELVGPQQAPLFHAEACVGCGLCEEACPDTAHAIRIEPLPGPAPASPVAPRGSTR